MLQTLAIENYRSLRRLEVSPGRLDVVTGGNGAGKSTLYRSLLLLTDASRNGIVAAPAGEGGLRSALHRPRTTDAQVVTLRLALR